MSKVPSFLVGGDYTFRPSEIDDLRRLVDATRDFQAVLDDVSCSRFMVTFEWTLDEFRDWIEDKLTRLERDNMSDYQKRQRLSYLIDEMGKRGLTGAEVAHLEELKSWAALKFLKMTEGGNG